MNEKITVVVINIFIVYFDVSAVFAAIIKKLHSTSEQEKWGEILSQIIRTTTTDKRWCNERERGNRGERERRVERQERQAVCWIERRANKYT